MYHILKSIFNSVSYWCPILKYRAHARKNYYSIALFYKISSKNRVEAEVPQICYTFSASPTPLSRLWNIHDTLPGDCRHRNELHTDLLARPPAPILLLRPPCTTPPSYCALPSQCHPHPPVACSPQHQWRIHPTKVYSFLNYLFPLILICCRI